MQEILPNTADSNAPLREQQFYELRLDDACSDGTMHYRVREARARWDENGKEIVWDEVESEDLPTIELAREAYERRRRTLMEIGFIYSDMEF